MRTTSRHLVAFLALVLLALSSCQVIRIEDQETLLRHDAAADQLELLLVYRGVSVWSQVKDDPGFLQGDEPEIDPRKLEQAVELAESVLGGRRRFKLLPGWLEMDLDDDDEDLTAADREVLAGIELLEVAAFLDEDGRLSCFQHLRLRGAKRLADHLNALTCEAIVKDLSPEDVAGSDYPQSARLWSRAARESWQWLRFEGPHVVISIPATHEDTARVLLDKAHGLLRDGHVVPVAVLRRFIVRAVHLIQMGPHDLGEVPPRLLLVVSPSVVGTVVIGDIDGPHLIRRVVQRIGEPRDGRCRYAGG